MDTLGNCGHVHFSYLPVAKKSKFIVPAYIAADGSMRCFVINSSRTSYQVNTPSVCSHVLPLPVAGHESFLTHDSWLTCHEFVPGITHAALLGNPRSYRAPLSPDMISAVKTLAAESPLYSERERRAILQQWPR